MTRTLCPSCGEHHIGECAVPPAAPARADEPREAWNCKSCGSPNELSRVNCRRCGVTSGCIGQTGSAFDCPVHDPRKYLAVPPSASPERPGAEPPTKKCGRCGRAIEHDFCPTCGPNAERRPFTLAITKDECINYAKSEVDGDITVGVGQPPSSPERERAQDTPWKVKWIDFPPTDQDLKSERIYAENIAKANAKGFTDKYKRPIAFVAEMIAYAEELKASEAALRARLQKAEKLMSGMAGSCSCQSPYDSACCDGCREIRAFLAESRR